MKCYRGHLAVVVLKRDVDNAISQESEDRKPALCKEKVMWWKL